MTVLSENTEDTENTEPQTAAAARPAPARRRKPLGTRAYKAFRVAALIGVVLFLVAPLFWMLLASLKTNVDIYDTGKSFLFTPSSVSISAST